MFSEEHMRGAMVMARGSILSMFGPNAFMIRFTGPLNEPAGAFVTLRTYPDMELRGCIGIMEPGDEPLGGVIASAARSVCNDPRFPPLRKSEFDRIIVEITVLSPHEEIICDDRTNLPDMIKMGTDGLSLEFKGNKGVFLPQVPTEQGWNIHEYLDNLCVKAGVPRSSWNDKACKISKFTGFAFREESPKSENLIKV